MGARAQPGPALPSPFEAAFDLVIPWVDFGDAGYCAAMGRPPLQSTRGFTEVKYLMHAKQVQALDEIPALAADFEEVFGRPGQSLVDRYRLTSLIAPSAMTGDMVRVAQAGGHDLSSLLVLGGGGAPRPPEQVRQIKASFTNALPNIGWGMTETNAIGAGVGGEDYLNRPASSGRCSQVLQIKVVDELGQAVPTGQRGELLVRGTSVFTGYWNRPDVNAQAFTDGDWFRTGDVATLDEDGFLYIVDRIKDLIIRGGENIGCGQVEAALLMHPDVQEAAVYAVPDERLGEEVGATVYGSDALDVAALREFLTAHLARFELPRYIVKAPGPLPRTPSGKILKREIKAAGLLEILQTPG